MPAHTDVKLTPIQAKLLAFLNTPDDEAGDVIPRAEKALHEHVGNDFRAADAIWSMVESGLIRPCADPEHLGSYEMTLGGKKRARIDAKAKPKADEKDKAKA